jgi:hypothetical protein
MMAVVAYSKIWQNKTVFLREIPKKGKSENDRVFTDDLNGGPGWTLTTDLALISIEIEGLRT